MTRWRSPQPPQPGATTEQVISRKTDQDKSNAKVEGPEGLTWGGWSR